MISATVIGLFDAASDELELSTTSDAVADMARAPKMERLPKGVTHVMRQFLWFRVRRQASERYRPKYIGAIDQRLTTAADL